MAILPINVYGDKILTQKTKLIEKIDDTLIANIANMFETMRSADGIGLAANQVGLGQSFFILDLSPAEGYEDFKPIVMINPEIIEFSDENSFVEEGCLSLPFLRAEVERPAEVKVKFLNTNEQEEIIEADGLFARAIQHEFDHLIGKMIPDNITPAMKKKFQKILYRIMNRQVDTDYLISDK